MIGIKLTFEHPWTREVMSFDAAAVTDTFVAVRWGMAGYYDIDLRTGKVKARTKKRGRFLWVLTTKIADIRDAVAKLHGRGLDDAAQRALVHTLSMPGPVRAELRGDAANDEKKERM